MEDYIEVFPQTLSTIDIRRCLPSSLRPHFWRRKAGNGQVRSVSESYTRRADAIRGALPERLLIRVLDGKGDPQRIITP